MSAMHPRVEYSSRIAEVRRLAEEFLATLDLPREFEDIEVVYETLRKITRDARVKTQEPCYNGDTHEERNRT